MVQDVKDKIAGRGIMISDVIQALLLAATIGFGTRIVSSIDKLTEQVGQLNTSTSLNAAEIAHNTRHINKMRGELDNHLHNYRHYVGEK